MAENIFLDLGEQLELMETVRKTSKQPLEKIEDDNQYLFNFPPHVGNITADDIKNCSATTYRIKGENRAEISLLRTHFCFLPDRYIYIARLETGKNSIVYAARRQDCGDAQYKAYLKMNDFYESWEAIYEQVQLQKAKKSLSQARKTIKKPKKRK